MEIRGRHFFTVALQVSASKHINLEFREEGQGCIQIHSQKNWASVARTSAIVTKEEFKFAHVFCRPTVRAAFKHIQTPSILERLVACHSWCW